MYAVYIRNILALDDKVLYYAWTNSKPDVSHLRVFGSIAYANIPKKVCGGKLELIIYWADETGYCLEDLESGNLITSRDVRFLEDEWPTDLAVVEGSGSINHQGGELMEVQPDGSHQPLFQKLQIHNLPYHRSLLHSSKSNLTAQPMNLYQN
jgi:hypothetical protein